MSASTSLADHFLIAMPALADPNFARGVTLICQHDQGGAMGLTINRPSDFTFGDVFEQMDLVTDVQGLAGRPVLLGGPVQPDRGFVLHDDPREWGSTLRFGHGLAVSTSRDILEALARGDGPARCLLALGYAGWTAGQLEQELGENAWLTVPANLDCVFDLPAQDRFRAAMQLLGFDPLALSGEAGHA